MSSSISGCCLVERIPTVCGAIDKCPNIPIYSILKLAMKLSTRAVPAEVLNYYNYTQCDLGEISNSSSSCSRFFPNVLTVKRSGCISCPPCGSSSSSSSSSESGVACIANADVGLETYNVVDWYHWAIERGADRPWTHMYPQVFAGETNTPCTVLCTATDGTVQIISEITPGPLNAPAWGKMAMSLLPTAGQTTAGGGGGGGGGSSSSSSCTGDVIDIGPTSEPFSGTINGNIITKGGTECADVKNYSAISAYISTSNLCIEKGGKTPSGATLITSITGDAMVQGALGRQDGTGYEWTVVIDPSAGMSTAEITSWRVIPNTDANTSTYTLTVDFSAYSDPKCEGLVPFVVGYDFSGTARITGTLSGLYIGWSFA